MFGVPVGVFCQSSVDKGGLCADDRKSQEPWWPGDAAGPWLGKRRRCRALFPSGGHAAAKRAAPEMLLGPGTGLSTGPDPR